MASSTPYYFLIIFFSLSSFVASQSQTRFKPTTLVLPVQKDSATGLHVTHIHKRTPLLPIPLLVDLDSRFIWIKCEENYISSTYHTPICNSTQCKRVGNHYCFKCNSKVRPGCHNNTCGVMTTNPITHRAGLAELGQDVLSIQAHGPSTGPFVSVPRFMFACAPANLLNGPLPGKVVGIAGLGHNPIALPSQLASHFGFRPKFALCLTSNNKGNGIILFGNRPYKLLPRLDVSDPVGFTPITVGPKGEYYIKVASIKIDKKHVPFNTSTFSKTKIGPSFTYAHISTTTSYTLLESSIFRAVTQFFAAQLTWAPRVSPVSPFGVCFNSTKLAWTRAGPAVPRIELVLQNESVAWRVVGANSMVEARPDVTCLGFVDGGVKPRTPIVIGAHQLENTLLQFDLAKSRLGFSSSLLLKRVSCVNFNFTATP